MNLHMIKSAFIVGLLLSSSAVCFGATEKTAYNASDIFNFTKVHEHYKLASEKEWLLHDETLGDYRSKIINNSTSLAKDKKYQALKNHSLDVRSSFYNTSVKISKQKGRIDQHAVKLAREINNMHRHAKHTIDFAFAKMAEYRRSFENDWKHDHTVSYFSDAVTSINFDRQFNDFDPIDCRDMTLKFIKAKNLLYGYYNHRLGLFHEGKFKPSRLSQSMLVSDIVSIKDASSDLKEASKPRTSYGLKKQSELKNWRFCTRAEIKVSKDSEKLYNYLSHVRDVMYGDPTKDKVISAYLSRK